MRTWLFYANLKVDNSSTAIGLLVRVYDGMDELSFSFALVPVLGVCALAIYLMLSQGHGLSPNAVRSAGAGLAALSLVLLSLLVGPTVGWWPESELESGATGVLFPMLACCSVVSAVCTITCRLTTHSVLWFALMLLANAGLYLIQGAHFLGIATVVVYAGTTVIAYLVLARWAERQPANRGEWTSREPFLACLTGALLSVTLLATIHHAFATEAQRTIAAEKNRGTTSLRRSALPKQTVMAAALDNGPDALNFRSQHRNVERLGVALYREQFIGVGVIAVLTLATLVGAVLFVHRNLPPDRSGKAEQ